MSISEISATVLIWLAIKIVLLKAYAHDERCVGHSEISATLQMLLENKIILLKVYALDGIQNYLQLPVFH